MTMADTLPVDSVWIRKTTRPRVVSSCQLVVTSPLVMLSLRHPLVSRRLVAPPPPAGCHIASHHPLVVPPTCPLVAPACCRIDTPRSLVAPPSHPLVTPAGSCVASRCAAHFSSHRPRRATLSSSRCLMVPPSRRLITPAGCCNISHRPLVVLPSRPHIVPAGCCVASPCAPLSSSWRAGHLRLAITLP